MIYSEVRHQPESGKCYLGSPSVLRMPDGAILATHDYFGPGSPHTQDGLEGLTSVYRSEDNGATWVNTAHIMNAYWATLFLHDGLAWLLGCSCEYGSIVIRRSDDGGFSWTNPVDSKSGLLFQGGARRENPNYHGAPVPVLFHGGRVYRAFEECEDAQWPAGFKSFVISAREGADLLDAASWKMSNKIKFDPNWIPGEYENPAVCGWLEGNVVASPDGRLFNILRCQLPMKVWKGHDPLEEDKAFNAARFKACCEVDTAAVIGVGDGGTSQRFDPEKGFVAFPGGGIGKFTIRRDPVTGRYLSLVNGNGDPERPCNRNVLSLAVSEDLRSWRLAKTLLEDDSGLDWGNSCALTGFQYVDWQFDGDDIIYLSRTAHRGAHNFHDSNRITFHTLKNFRSLFNGKREVT